MSARDGAPRRLRAGFAALLTAGVTAGALLGTGSAPAALAGTPGTTAVAVTGVAAGTGGRAADAAPAAGTPTAAAATTPLVRVTSVTPTTATPTTPVQVDVDVTNPTAAAVAPRRVVVRVGSAGLLRTRAQVAAFATSGGRGDDPVVASAPITGTLAPRARVRVTATLPAGALPLRGAYGVLPVTVEMQGTRAGGTTSVTARTPTYLPFQVRKEYEPLSVAFAVPLTLDPDPALAVATGDDRTAAWTKAVGPASRLTRLVSATSTLPVAWAIDPAATGSGSRSTSTQAGDTAVAALQRGLTGRLRASAAGRDLWSLPPDDPDLVALSASGAGLALLARWTASATTLADDLGVLGLQRLAWPVGGPLSGDRVNQVAHAFGGTGPAAFLTPGASVDADPEVTGTAARHTRDGQAILAYDDTLSRVFSQVGGSASARRAGAPTAAEGTQRFLAESATLLAESPGRRRVVLVAGARDLDPSGSGLSDLVSAVSTTPWLSVTRTSDAVTLARDPASPQVDAVRQASDALSPGPSPVTSSDVDDVSRSVADVAGLSQVLSAVTTPRGSSALLPDDATLRALTSTRWRFAASAFRTADDAVNERLTTLTSGVSVVPSSFNFLAEHGVLQITVVNDLDVEVHDVRLVVAPQGRPPRLRITDPVPPLRISPHSRTQVRLRVEAVAAGVVPISTHVETPSGTRLGTDAPVRVRVQPTNGWLMLALGGLVGVVFLAGLYRALRAGTPRVSSEDLKEIDLE